MSKLSVILTLTMIYVSLSILSNVNLAEGCRPMMRRVIKNAKTRPRSSNIVSPSKSTRNNGTTINASKMRLEKHLGRPLKKKLVKRRKANSTTTVRTIAMDNKMATAPTHLPVKITTTTTTLRTPWTGKVQKTEDNVEIKQEIGGKNE